MAPKRSKAHPRPVPTEAAPGAGVGSEPSLSEPVSARAGATEKETKDIPEWLQKVFATEENLEARHLPAAAPNPEMLAGEKEDSAKEKQQPAATRASARKRTKGKDTTTPRVKRAKASADTSDKPSTRASAQKPKKETGEKSKKESKREAGEEGKSEAESETGSILESEDEQRRLQRAMNEPIETVNVQPTAGPMSIEFEVTGSRGKPYKVTIARNPTCTCRDFLVRKPACKHILHVLVKVLHVPLDHPMFSRGENNVVVEGKEMKELVKAAEKKTEDIYAFGEDEE